ncbi:MAG TPA: phosphoribosylamine--glycine ligase [Syntrophorhabdaceae bacterium]|nr:phosphoribosylamine--glycine ligase [Syntrophorhabdaceae bacterium]
MNILILGSGGREHALAWKLSKSKDVRKIYAIPGNGGISDVAECVDIAASDIQGLLSFSTAKKIDLVIVGPENLLAAGIVDAFQKYGIPIFGPDKNGACIESSKVFAKELMAEYQIPTAPFKTFDEYESARAYLDSIEPPFVIKADGLCAGKGAYVIKDMEEAHQVIKSLMVNGIYGEAGKRILVESFLPGIEASYLVFTDGTTMLPMLAAQDHKPLLDGDTGPNTGGMGAYTPVPFISKALEEEIKNSIMVKTISALKEKGITYKGVLYGGLMLSNNKPYVIEFNARFGDPETQPIMFNMQSDILPVLMACSGENLGSIPGIEWRDGISVCVVIASKGYPENPEKGKVISGLEALKDNNDVMVFHAGTKKIDGKCYTSAQIRQLAHTSIRLQD